MSDRRKAAMLKLYEAYLTAFDAYHNNRDNLTTALKSFCSAYVDVASAINPKLTAKRAEYLFKLDADLCNRDILNAHIYTAREYATNVVSRIDANDELNLLSEAPAIIFDYAQLMKIIESVYDIPFGSFAGERNMKVDAYTSYKLANQIYWGHSELQRSNALNGYAVFGLRHSIELAGKELLGVRAIVDADGSVYKYGTQLPWKIS